MSILEEITKQVTKSQEIFPRFSCQFAGYSTIFETKCHKSKREADLDPLSYQILIIGLVTKLDAIVAMRSHLANGL